MQNGGTEGAPRGDGPSLKFTILKNYMHRARAARARALAPRAKVGGLSQL
jgi:hypothetical protein